MKKNILVLIVVIVLIIIGALYYWFQPKTAGDAQMAAVGAVNSEPTAEVKAMLAKLQTHLLLPTDEVPQIGQIDDPAQAIKAQPFVTGAQKGDLLIVYVKAQKAIVYSPSRDLIINVGPISMDSDSPASPAPAQTSASTTVKIPDKK